MEKDTANLLIGTLQLIGSRMQECSIKIMTMERVLEDHPDIQREYTQRLQALYDNPATMANQASSVERFEALRDKLFRD